MSKLKSYLFDGVKADMDGYALVEILKKDETLKTLLKRYTSSPYISYNDAKDAMSISLEDGRKPEVNLSIPLDGSISRISYSSGGDFINNIEESVIMLKEIISRVHVIIEVN